MKSSILPGLRSWKPALLLLLAVLAGCREYHDDILDLWEQVDQNTSDIAQNTLAVEALQRAFNQGMVLYSIVSDGEGGVTITTSSGDTFILKGARGETPVYSIAGNGHLLAEVNGVFISDCGRVVAAVPDVHGTVGPDGHLLLNGRDLGSVTGRDGHAVELSFRLESGELFADMNGSSTSLGTVKGPQGDDGLSAMLPDLSFSMENDSLCIRFGDEVISGGQLAADFEIRDGAYWYNGEKLGDITLSGVDFEAVGGSLYVAGKDTGIQLHQQIFMVQNQDEVVLHLPLADGTYCTVVLPEVVALGLTDYKVLHQIQSLEFVPETADGKVHQGVVLDYSGNILQNGQVAVTFRVTPASAAGALAKLFATDPASFTLHQHNFPVRSYVGELVIDTISGVDATTGLFTVQSSSRLDGNPASEALSVYLAVNHVTDSCNLDIASQYVPVERSVIQLSELVIEPESAGMSYYHELCCDDPESFFTILDSDYAVYADVDGTLRPLSDFGYSCTLVYSMTGHLNLSSTMDGIRVSLTDNACYGDTYSVSVGADLDGNGVPDVALSSTHEIDVVRCHTFAMSFVEQTLDWSSQARTVECLEDAATADLPEFFMLADMEAMKTALTNRDISVSFNSSNLELRQDNAGYLKVELAANTMPLGSGYPFAATFQLTNDQGWMYIITVRLTVREPEGTDLQKAASYWTGDGLNTLLFGAADLKKENGGFAVVLNDAFRTDQLNPGCRLKAELPASVSGVTLRQSDDIYSLSFSDAYSRGAVILDFSVCSASNENLVFSTLTSVPVQLPSVLCTLSVADGTLTASSGTLSLGGLVSLNDWSGAPLWSGSAGLPAYGMLSSAPSFQCTVYVPALIYPDLEFNAGADAVLDNGTYEVSNCTSMALAPTWNHAEEYSLDVKVEMTFPWLVTLQGTLMGSVSIPEHAEAL